MGAIFLRCETDGDDPLVDQPRILTRAQVAISIEAADLFQFYLAQENGESKALVIAFTEE